ncbi:MAG TPA: beta-ketoacyl synthase N-terminal-like domain-containing protein [Pseudonocardiaceae bacterium]|nr:beta-ketoacyl synthase N-terminal-like domain-containing protein [Pseudonocardiaceae bacterium]
MEQIAIVGMAALMPGAATLEQYWRNLVAGVDAITEVPEARWDSQFYNPAAAHRPDRVYCRHGGFVDDLATFEPLRYGIMPASVPDIEPDQLISLEVAAAAIEDAGGADRMPDGDRIGVILGRGGTLSGAQARFDQRVRLPTQTLQTLRELIPELGEDRLDQIRQRLEAQMGGSHADGVLGATSNLAASRIANRLNLHGTAYTVDAACASSLIAIENAVGELASGRLDAVLAGGTHHTHDITFWAAFSQLGALSRRGQIRPFDAASDGLLIGEGSGIVVLKRLSDAQRDGDRVYAVIRGTGTSSDGRSASMFNPVSAGQVIAVRRAWQAAGLDPAAADALGLIEAHGTGTPAGDTTELATLAAVFGPDDGRPRAVIGSVKSMIGHTMPAAGVAGFIKAALAVYHGVQPPTLHCEQPRSELERTRFLPIATSRPWEGSGPRRAGVNAFGFGGINTHVIIEEYSPPRHQKSTKDTAVPLTATASVVEPEQALWLSAADPAALAQLLAGDYHTVRTQGTSRARSSDGAADGPCRLGVLSPTDKRLATAGRIVERGEAWRRGSDIWFAPAPMLGAGGGKVAFVFPGIEAEFAPRTADIAARLGVPDREWSATDLAQRGVGSIELGRLLTDALRRLDVVADAVAGYSIGEWTAAVVSGQMSAANADDFLQLFKAESVEVAGHVFAAVSAGVESVAPLLSGYPDVVISHDNAPNQCIVNGPEQLVEKLIAELRSRYVICQLLPFRAAFHTPKFGAGLKAIGAALGQWQVRPPTAPVWSGVLAAPFPSDPDEVNDLFVRHMVEPVRFRQLVDAMYESGVRAFLQVGVGQLPTLVQENLREREHLAIAVSVAGRSGMDQLRRVATALWVEGATPDPEFLSAPGTGPRTAMINAPGPHRGPVLPVNLGTPLIRLGDGAADLLHGDVATTEPVTATETAATEVTATETAAVVETAATETAVFKAAVTKAATVSGTSSGAALDTLRLLARSSSAAAELMGMFEQTAQDTATVPPADTRLPTAIPGPSSGTGPVHTTLRVSLDTMPFLMDHCFFLQPEDWPHPEDRWPVMAATTVVHHMVEAVRQAVPGLEAIEVRQAKFHRWLLAAPATDVAVTVTPAGEGQWSVTFGGFASAVVVMTHGYPADTPAALAGEPAGGQPPPLTAEQIYRERVLFHGPRFQGITEIQLISDTHVRGAITTPEAPGALLDSLVQLLGAWLDTMDPDRPVVLPVAMERIRFFGPAPAPGTVVTGVARIRRLDDKELVADLQIRHDDRIWVQLEGCRERRFDSSPNKLLADRFPGHHPMTAVQPEGWTMVFDWWSDPVVRDMAAVSLLGQRAAQEYQRMRPSRRRQWLLGRIAAKDAVRNRQWEEGRGAAQDPDYPIYPIEIGIENDHTGRPWFRPRPGSAFTDCDVSLAHCAEIGVAIAQPWEPDADHDAPGVGIDVVEVTSRDEDTGRNPLTVDELRLLGEVADGERDVWLAGLRAAKGAVAKAEHRGLTDPGPDGDAGRFVVLASDAVGLLVNAGERSYRVGLREATNPEGLRSRRYVVGWTWGPVE